MSIIIGLTGQSGAGKTTVCRQFENAGFGIINCDDVARECTVDGSECNKELSKIFPDCFDENLRLDRKGISDIIFSDRDMLRKFDDIVYPFINDLIDKKIAEFCTKYKYIVLDAPTLFEAGADKKCDIIVGVIADKDIRLGRIIRRDGITREQALRRFASQLDTSFYEQHCDMLISNDSSQQETLKNTERIIQRIKERSDGYQKKKD